MSFWRGNGPFGLIRPVGAGRRPLSSGGHRGRWPRLRPPARRMIHRRAWLITPPGRPIRWNRSAFMRLAAQLQPSAKRFISRVRLKPRIASAHHAALAPNSPDGSCPPARSDFVAECASSLLPQRSRSHQMTPSPGPFRLVTTPNSLCRPLPRTPGWETAAPARPPVPVAAAARGSPGSGNRRAGGCVRPSWGRRRPRPILVSDVDLPSTRGGYRRLRSRGSRRGCRTPAAPGFTRQRPRPQPRSPPE